jgi:hypothetical protein
MIILIIVYPSLEKESYDTCTRQINSNAKLPN